MEGAAVPTTGKATSDLVDRRFYGCSEKITCCPIFPSSSFSIIRVLPIPVKAFHSSICDVPSLENFWEIVGDTLEDVLIDFCSCSGAEWAHVLNKMNDQCRKLSIIRFTENEKRRTRNMSIFFFLTAHSYLRLFSLLG